MSFMRDVSFATRTLRKNPAFTLTAIVTLALGIGATTAIFSVVNSVLLRPLPYDHPERLTIIWGELRTRKVYDWLFAPGDLKDLMDQATLFDGIAAVRTGPAPLTRAMTKLLVGVSPTAPLTFVAMVTVFLAIAAIACWLPARRAAAVQPNVALREGA